MDVCGPEKERQTGDSWRTARRHPSHFRATSITAKRVRGVYSPRRGDEDTPDGWFGRANARIGAFLARPGARAHNFAIGEQDVCAAFDAQKNSGGAAWVRGGKTSLCHSRPDVIAIQCATLPQACPGRAFASPNPVTWPRPRST